MFHTMTSFSTTQPANLFSQITVLTYSGRSTKNRTFARHKQKSYHLGTNLPWSRRPHSLYFRSGELDAQSSYVKPQKASDFLPPPENLASSRGGGVLPHKLFIFSRRDQSTKRRRFLRTTILTIDFDVREARRGEPAPVRPWARLGPDHHE